MTADWAPKLELTMCSPGSLSSAHATRSSADLFANVFWQTLPAARRRLHSSNSLIGDLRGGRGVKKAALAYLAHNARTDQEITETFAGPTFVRVAIEQR
jgi:hypothetical protein